MFLSARPLELRSYLRDGPLENLWEGGGGGFGQVKKKKKSRKGKLNEKKLLQAN